MYIPTPLKSNNVLTWMSANGSVFLTSYLVDKPIKLSWTQFKNVAPNLANSLTYAGLNSSRMPETWKNHSYLLDIRGAGVYNKNIPSAIARLGVNAIAEFKEGKHWSHQISYKEGIAKGFTKEQLASPKNGVFEKGIDNIRRGSKIMPDGWGVKGNPGKLQITFFNELQALNMVCKSMFKNAYEGFTVSSIQELMFSSLEKSLAYHRNEITLGQAVTEITKNSLNVGLNNSLSAAMIIGICAYLPGAGILLSTTAPVLAAMATMSMFCRVHDIFTDHLESQGFISPYSLDYQLIDDFTEQCKNKNKLLKEQLDYLLVEEELNLKLYEKNQTELEEYHQIALLALKQQNDNVAKEALFRKNKAKNELTRILLNIKQQAIKLDELKKQIIKLEKQIEDAKNIPRKLSIVELLKKIERSITIVDSIDIDIDIDGV